MPSSSAYDIEGQLFFALNYFHDRLSACGETRPFYRWCQFFKESVESTCCLVSEDNWYHFRTQAMEFGRLDTSVASTEGLVCYFAFVLDSGRKSELMEFASSQLQKMCNRILENSLGAEHHQLEQGLIVHTRASLVEGLQAMFSSSHKTAAVALVKQWNLMKNDGLLAFDLSLEHELIPLADVVTFAFRANRHRRQRSQQGWGQQQPSGRLLFNLQKALIQFISERFNHYVMTDYRLKHDINKSPPSRRTSGAGQSKMSVEAIWEVLDHAQQTGKNARQALQFSSSALSSAGGNHESCVDSWTRRRQLIYDERASISLCGASHFNLISDASTHSGREVLVSLLWSHENNTAVILPCQEVLPCDMISPGELELADVVERIAKQNKLQRLAAYRQLQGISHQLSLATNGAVESLESFRPPDNVILRRVEPGERRICVVEGCNFRASLVTSSEDGDQHQVVLPTEENSAWWVGLPLLTLQLDQGAVGCAGVMYAMDAMKTLTHVRFDIFHRAVNDMKLSLKHACHGRFLQCQMHSNYLFGLAYRPFNTGTFLQHKKRLRDIMFSSKTADTCQEFVSMWEDIRDDLGLPSSSSPEQVWNAVAECSTFVTKRTLPKLMRWFSWHQAAVEQLPEMHALKLVLGYHYRQQGDSKLDPDSAEERRSLAAAARQAKQGSGSKEDLRKEFSRLKESLGGGTKLAYFLMSERLWAMCHMLVVTSRPLWDWYSDAVRTCKNADDSLRRLIGLVNHWHEDAHLQALAAVPINQDPALVRLWHDKRILDTPELVLELSMHFLKRRAWSMSKHACPPDNYAELLTCDRGPAQDLSRLTKFDSI